MPKVIVVVEGGIVQEILSDEAIPGLSIVVEDHDTQGEPEISYSEPGIEVKPKAVRESMKRAEEQWG